MFEEKSCPWDQCAAHGAAIQRFKVIKAPQRATEGKQVQWGIKHLPVRKISSMARNNLGVSRSCQTLCLRRFAI
jgi:hypothetical protein